MDRHEPRYFLAFGGVLVVQTATALLWAGGAAERLSALEQKSDTAHQLIERTARLEVQTENIRSSLVRIEFKLDRGVRAEDD